MPTKRRRPVEETDVAAPSKRVTRSSTKAQADGVAPSDARPKNQTPKLSESGKSEKVASKPKSTKASTTSKSKSTKFPKAKTSTISKSKPSSASNTPSSTSQEPQPPTSNTTDSITTETTTKQIIHNTIKKPMNCHTYKTPSLPSPPAVGPLLFAHGASGTASAPAVVNFCTGYSSLSGAVTFDGSTNLSVRVNQFHACIDKFTTEAGDGTLVLGGRSMGARAAVMAASEVLAKGEEGEEGRDVVLVLVSYPLKGPKDVRDQILLDLPGSVKVLFVIGARDAMCPLEMLDEVKEKMKAESWSVVVEGLDHGMHGKGEMELGRRAGRMAAQWVTGERMERDRVLRMED